MLTDLSLIQNLNLQQGQGSTNPLDLPFREGPSSSQVAIAGPFAEQGYVPMKRPASLNTVVSHVGKGTAPLHAGPEKRAMLPTTNFLPTPVRVKKLEVLLYGYDDHLKKFLIDGFSVGFSLHSNLSEMGSRSIKNHKSALEHLDIVDEKIKKEMDKGRVKGPFDSHPFENFICSPIGLVPKKELGQFRLIHDLSYPKGASVNSNIPPEFSAVNYQNIETVIDIVQSYGHNCLMSKSDIQEAFRLIPIKQSDHRLLGFSWRGKFYHDCVLAFGASSSCQIFEKFSSALQWILNKKFNILGISHLLDDFFFCGKKDTSECLNALQTFLAMAEHLGVPIKQEKTHYPTTCLTIYGIEIDSTEMVARLPLDKIEKISALLLKYKCKRKISLKNLQSLLGLLNFACSVIIPGRAFLRRLYDLTIGHTSPHFMITLNADARADLNLWHTFIENYNGKSCFLFQNWISSDVIKLYSDSAGVHGGYAAVFGNKWFAKEWSEEMKDLHITVKELFPIVVALDFWGHLLANHKILFLTDNAAVADIINKTTSKEKNCMKLIRRMVLSSLQFNIFFRAKHIPGKTNVICDLLSRFSFQEAHRIAPWLNATQEVVPSHLLMM